MAGAETVFNGGDPKEATDMAAYPFLVSLTSRSIRQYNFSKLKSYQRDITGGTQKWNYNS